MADRTLLGYLAAAGAISIYAGMFTVGRAGSAAGLDGYDQTALRFLVSTILVLPFGMFRLKEILGRIGLRRSIMLALLNGATYSAVFLGGLTFAPVAYGAALVPGLQPFVVMLLAFMVEGRKPPRSVLSGNLVCICGLAVVFLDQSGTWRTSDLIGIALFLCSAAMWGSYAYFVRHWNVPARTALVILGSISPVLFLPAYLWFRGLGILDGDSTAIALQIVYQGGLVGIVAVFLYPFAISVLGSSQVAALSPAMPALATLIGAVAIGEVPTTLQWTSIVIVTLGLAISQIGTHLLPARRSKTP